MKKIAIIIVAVVLVVVLGGGYFVCNMMCNSAVEAYNSGNKLQAMETLSTFRFLPSASECVNDFESEILNQLKENTWRSEDCRWQEKTEVRYANWEYTFLDNGKGSRLDSSHEYGGKDTVQGPYDVTYKLVYSDGKLYVRIHSIDDNDYLVNLRTEENGDITVMSFDGLVQYRQDYTAKFTRNQTYVDSASN